MDRQSDGKASPTQPAVALRGVSYAYPRTECGVSAISLSVEPGTIYGLLGVNGAGKTTLMRLMLGLIRPAAGTISYFGEDSGKDRRRAMASIGSLIETPSLYGHLTAREHLRVFAAYTGANGPAVDHALDLVGLADVAGRLVRRLSLGMKQRLALATALLHDPSVLILDEPTNGLDPAGIAGMRALLRRLAGELGKTVIVSSHLLPEVEKTATRIGILHEGTMRFEGTPAELAVRLGGAAGLKLRTPSPERSADVLAAEGLSCRAVADHLLVAAVDDAAAARAIAALARAGIGVYEAVRETPSLERDFLDLTGGERDAG